MSFRGRENFYVTLPSNASRQQFPQNMQSNYTVLMPTPLDFAGEWEVALTEIHYPKSWRNIFENDTFKLHFVSPQLEALPRCHIQNKYDLSASHGAPNALPEDIHILKLNFVKNQKITRKLYLEEFHKACIKSMEATNIVGDFVNFPDEQEVQEAEILLSEDKLIPQLTKPKKKKRPKILKRKLDEMQADSSKSKIASKADPPPPLNLSEDDNINLLPKKDSLVAPDALDDTLGNTPDDKNRPGVDTSSAREDEEELDEAVSGITEEQSIPQPLPQFEALVQEAHERFVNIARKQYEPPGMPPGVGYAQTLDPTMKKEEVLKHFYNVLLKENMFFPLVYREFKTYFPEGLPSDDDIIDQVLAFDMRRIAKNYVLLFIDYNPDSFYGDVARHFLIDESDMSGFVRIKSFLPVQDILADNSEYAVPGMADHQILLVPKKYAIDTAQFSEIFQIKNAYNTDSYFYSFKREEKTCIVPPGFYPTAKSLLDALNITIPSECSQFIQFRFNAIGLIEIFSADCRLYSIEFPESIEGSLADMIGLNSELVAPIRLPPIDHTRDNYLFLRTFKFPYKVEMERGVYSFYVYSDITEEQIVGNSFSHLLRIISIDETRLTMNKQTFSNDSYYIPLRVKHITSMSIAIKTDFGKPVHFTSGKTVCQLHFRKTT
jgi:hypothetical protein